MEICEREFRTKCVIDRISDMIFVFYPFELPSIASFKGIIPPESTILSPGAAVFYLSPSCIVVITCD